MIDPAQLFPFRKPQAAPALRLVCLPFAGGAASLYRAWPKLLAPDIEVCPVELPGRGLRFGEAAMSDMPALCDHLAPAIERLLDRPLALFGHSMGARIAFELALRFDGSVVRLFAAGSPPPGTPMRYGPSRDDRPSSTLSDAEFKQRLRDLGGTPTEILDHAELMERVLPIVRSDFTLVERYRAEPSARVSCPITVFTGLTDPGATPAIAATWRLRTTASCRLVELDAGHFFLDSHRETLLRELRRDLFT